MATLYVPPTFQTVLTPVTELVTTGCTMCTVDSSFSSHHLKLGRRVVEVEARLGKHSDHGFSSGVTPEMFNSVLHKLESFQGWLFASTDWETVHDYTYKVDHHVVRTRKTFVPDVPLEHIVKKRLKNVDVTCSSTKPLPPLLNTLDIRTSLSLEQHVELPEGFTVQPEAVVKKQQKRFQHKNWLFVVAQTKRAGSIEYEVEIEYTDLNAAIGDTDKQHYIALGMLMKLVDFYPPLQGPFMLLPL